MRYLLLLLEAYFPTIYWNLEVITSSQSLILLFLKLYIFGIYPSNQKLPFLIHFHLIIFSAFFGSIYDMHVHMSIFLPLNHYLAIVNIPNKLHWRKILLLFHHKYVQTTSLDHLLSSCLLISIFLHFSNNLQEYF